MFPPCRQWLVLAAVALVLANAWAQKSDPSDMGELPPPRLRGDILLDEAAARLKDRGWMTTHFRETQWSPGVPFSCEGEFTTGPGRRVALRMRVHVGQARGEFVTLCDGSDVYRGEKIGEEWQFVRFSLRRLDESLAKLDATDVEKGRIQEYREAFPASLGFSGIAPRLLGLKQTHTFDHVSAAYLPDVGPVFRLDGGWRKEELARRLGDAKDPATGKPLKELWFENPTAPVLLGVLRRCRVYLGRSDRWWQPHSLWPHRIEWLGYTPEKGGEQILMAIDFTSPVFPTEADGQRLCTPPAEWVQLAREQDPAREIDGWIRDQLAQQRSALFAKPFDPSATKPR